MQAATLSSKERRTIQANRYIGGWGGWKHGQNKILGTPTSLMIGHCRAKPTAALFCHPNTMPCSPISSHFCYSRRTTFVFREVWHGQLGKMPNILRHGCQSEFVGGAAQPAQLQAGQAQDAFEMGEELTVRSRGSLVSVNCRLRILNERR